LSEIREVEHAGRLSLIYKFSSDRGPGKDSVEGGAGAPLVQQFAAQSLLIKEAHIGVLTLSSGQEI
jgi:hypothetical protein